MNADPWFTESLDWYFLPVFNPDGYQFTHEHVGIKFFKNLYRYKILFARLVYGERLGHFTILCLAVEEQMQIETLVIIGMVLFHIYFLKDFVRII